jgi:hypothetical protein
VFERAEILFPERDWHRIEKITLWRVIASHQRTLHLTLS